MGLSQDTAIMCHVRSGLVRIARCVVHVKCSSNMTAVTYAVCVTRTTSSACHTCAVDFDIIVITFASAYYCEAAYACLSC
jgi:hypothetical protein